jgi:hypothetical protein
MVKSVAVGLLCAILLGCATPAPSSPAPSATASDSIADVEAALETSGLTLVATVDATPSVGDASCVPGQPVRAYMLYQESPQATFGPDEKPPVEVFVFASPTERRAYQARISADGSEINGPGCTENIDYAFTPHWDGGGRYLLQVVSDDPAAAADVAAAAALLGSP